MEIRVLQYFLTVAREESITRAAEVLHITQPTLSRQLAQLEEEVGVTLFARGSRKIALTDEGMLLRRRAEEIVELVDQTQQELMQQDTLVDGTVNIGCGELAAVELLADLFSAFSKKYPAVNYNLFTSNADHVKMKMDRGLMDLGLLLEPVDIDKYDFIRLDIREHWVALLRPDDPLAQKQTLSPEDFRGLPVILARRAGVQNELANWFGDVFKDLHILFTSNLSTNASVMVHKGLGYAITIDGSLPFLDGEKICRRPLNPPLNGSTVLAWKRNQPFSPAATKFIEHMREWLNPRDR